MSRKLSDLTPAAEARSRRLIEATEAAGCPILVYCTRRLHEEQARLFRQGRSLAEIEAMAKRLAIEFVRPDLGNILLDVGPQYGPIVTFAAPGQSAHEYDVGLDGAPIRNGKLVWGTAEPEDLELWYRYGEAAEAVGLEWAGRWTRNREFPHVQMPGFDWKEEIRKRLKR